MNDEKQTPYSRAAEAARAVSGLAAPAPKGFFEAAKEFKEKHPVATNVLKLGAAASIVAGGGILLHQELTQPNASQQAGIDQYNAATAETEAYRDSIDQAINANYDQQAVVGQINVEQGTTLYDPSVAIVEGKIGQDTYNESAGRLNDALLSSTKSFSPQPGESYAVVETDIDPSAKNGTEYVTVPMSQVKPEATDTIPAPIQSNQQLPTLSTTDNH